MCVHTYAARAKLLYNYTYMHTYIQEYTHMSWKSKQLHNQHTYSYTQKNSTHIHALLFMLLKGVQHLLMATKHSQLCLHMLWKSTRASNIFSLPNYHNLTCTYAHPNSNYVCLNAHTRVYYRCFSRAKSFHSPHNGRSSLLRWPCGAQRHSGGWLVCLSVCLSACLPACVMCRVTFWWLSGMSVCLDWLTTCLSVYVMCSSTFLFMYEWYLFGLYIYMYMYIYIHTHTYTHMYPGP
jgi:hypothetical protein